METVGSQIRQHLSPVILITIFSIAIYANTLKNGFVYDDRYAIVNNDLIKEFGNVSYLVAKDYFYRSGELSYRPVVTLSYFCDYALFGLKPWGYHLINILLHAVNGVLTYMFLTLIIPSSAISHLRPSMIRLFTNLPFLTALLFVTHPVLTEAVNAVSFREDLLAFLFYMSALNLYLLLRPSSYAYHKSLALYLLYAASCLLYFLALFSKEMAATLPLILYCYEWLYINKKKGLSSLLLNPYSSGYIIVTAVYLYIRFYHFHNPQESEFIAWGLTERILTAPWLVVNYLKLILFPVSLSVDYYFVPVRYISSQRFLLSLTAIISLLAAALLIRREEKGATFGIVFFAVTLLPVYNIIPIANPLAERYLYLPAVGLCLSMGLIIPHVVRTLNSRVEIQGIQVFMFFLAIISVNSVSVVNRNEVWMNDYSLWSDAARKVPNSSRPYNDLGNVLYEKGRLDDAIKQYQTAIRLKPDFLEPHNNLGMIYSQKGRFDDAAQEFKAALKVNPNHPDVRFNLGSVYNKLGKLDEAVEEFKVVIRLNPGFMDAHYYLGVIYMKKGLRDEARKELETVLKLKPDYLLVRQLMESLSSNRQ